MPGLQQPAPEEPDVSAQGAEYRACLLAEIEMAEEAHRRTHSVLSGFSWFEWGLRRALALLDQGPEADDFAGVLTGAVDA